MITEQRHLWRSFAGGEIAAEMYGRFDLAKNQTGLKRCYNFMVTPQGVLTKRSGSKFISEAASPIMRFETFIAPDGKGFLLAIRNLNTEVFNQGTLVTTLSTPWNAAELDFLSSAQFVNDMTICARNYAPHFIRRINDASWANNNIVFNSTLASPTGLAVAANIIAAFPAGDPLITYNYVVTSLTADGVESAPSVSAFNNNVLRIAGNNNTLTWTSVASAFRYNVYSARSGGSYGFVGSSDTNSFVDDNINPDLLTQPPAVIASFTSASDYPRTVAFHEQRFLLANTPNDPQSFWASGLAGFEYFKASVPPQDDQAFTYQLSSKRASPVRHMLALRDVLFFTENGVHKVYTPNGGPFAPNGVSSILVSAYGAVEDIRPQEVGNSVLFPEARSNHIIALRFDGSEDGYAGADLSLVAPHLTDGYTWKQTAFQRAPFPVWWGLRSDGILIGITYVAEQQVYAWFQLALPGGTINTFAVVPEDANDSIYCHVQRLIDGQFEYYIERLEPLFGENQLQQSAFFVDCGITYNGAPTTVITGLGHLEGEQVVALADGQPMGPYTVTSGQITIDEEASTVHVGKSFAGELELLPLAYETAALGVGVEKIPSAVHIRMKRSEGIEAGSSFDNLYPLLPQVTELIGDMVQLRDGVHPVTIDGEWANDASVVIRQEMPLPAIITGIALDFAGAE